MIYDYEGNPVSAGASFVTVKEYGAKGDGVTDDSASIQSALNDMSGGGIILFPKGTYLIKSNVHFYSKQTLWFESGATLLQGALINNLLISFCGSSTGAYNGVHDCLIYGATFDGGEYEGNNTLVGIVHSKNIRFENCTFKNAYGAWHNIEINSSYNIKIINCDFEGSRKNSSNGELIQIDAYDNGATWPWSGLQDNTISKYVEICGCIFHTDTMSPAIGNHSSTADDSISIHDNIFDQLTSSRGAINLQSATNVDIYNNIFTGCTKGVGSGGATYYIHDNRFIDATTAISGSTSVAHDNMINGTYVE